MTEDTFRSLVLILTTRLSYHYQIYLPIYGNNNNDVEDPFYTNDTNISDPHSSKHLSYLSVTTGKILNNKPILIIMSLYGWYMIYQNS